MSAGDAEVVVVGAGFAGLSAALALRKAGVPVVVLEARDRVGGRSMAGTLNGYTVDLGGQWIGPAHTRLASLAAAYGVATAPQYASGRKIVEYGGRIATYTGLIPKLPIVGLLEADLMIRRINRLAERVPLEAPWSAANAALLDAETLESWKRRTVRTKSARALLDIAVRSIFTVEAGDLSLLWFLFYCRSGAGFEALASIEKGAQERVFVGGGHQIAAAMARELGDAIRLSEPVSAIAQDGRSVRVATPSGTVTARYAIVAVPPPLAGRIAYQPALPIARDALFQRMAMGSVIKAYAAYPTPFWRARGLSGEVISDTGAFSPVFDASPSDGSFGALVGFFDGNAARVWSERGSDARRTSVLENLVRYFGPEAAQPIDYAEQNWPAEIWSRGCYAAFAGPGTLTAYGSAIRTPCGRIHWAGTETSSVSCGYLDGAVLSGDRAAAEVLAARARGEAAASD